VAEVETAAQQAKRPVNSFKEKLQPLDDAFNKNLGEMKKAAAAARKNDKPAAQRAIENIAEKPFGRNLDPPGTGPSAHRANPTKVEPGTPADDLEKLFDKFKKDADKGDAKAMDQAIPAMDRAYQKLAEKPKRAADKLKNAIDDVVKATEAGNPFPPLRKLKDALDDFVNDTQSDPSPEVRDAGALAVDEAYPFIADLIKNAEENAKNPDKKKAQAAVAARQQAKKPYFYSKSVQQTPIPILTRLLML
jgi:hypothetical protein